MRHFRQCYGRSSMCRCFHFFALISLCIWIFFYSLLLPELAYPAGAHACTTDVCGVNVPQSLLFCLVFCRSLFVLLSIVYSFLQFTSSDYPFDTFKLFLCCFSYTIHVSFLRRITFYEL